MPRGGDVSGRRRESREDIYIVGVGGGGKGDKKMNLRAKMATIFLISFAWVVFSHEADGAGIHVERVDVVLSKEANA